MPGVKEACQPSGVFGALRYMLRMAKPSRQARERSPGQLTHHGKIELALTVACREGGKFTDVHALVLQLQVGEADGAINEGGSQEFHSFLVGRQYGNPHSWVVDGHVLLGAIGGLLPRDLGNLHTGQWVGKTTVQDHICTDEAIHGVVHLHHLCVSAWQRGRQEVVSDRHYSPPLPFSVLWS